MRCQPGRFPDLRVILLAAPSRMKTVLSRPGGVTFLLGLCDVPFVRLRASAHVPCQDEKSLVFSYSVALCGFHHRSQLRDSGGIAPPSLLSPAFRRSTRLISYLIIGQFLSEQGMKVKQIMVAPLSPRDHPLPETTEPRSVARFHPSLHGLWLKKRSVHSSPRQETGQ